MPFGRMVSNGRGSFTFRISFDTGARFSRSTLLVGIDLSWAGSPWPHPVAAKAAARSTAAAACLENLKLTVRLIDILNGLSGRILLHLCHANSSRMPRKKCPPFCHSERSEESLFLFLSSIRREIPCSARNDKMHHFFS